VFIRDFKQVLFFDIKRSHKAIVEKRMRNLIFEWNCKLIQYYDDEKLKKNCLRNICHDIKHNERFKIPYSIVEVEKSIASIMMFLNSPEY